MNDRFDDFAAALMTLTLALAGTSVLVAVMGGLA